MRVRRAVVLSLLATTVAALMFLGLRKAAQGGPRVPSRDDEVLEKSVSSARDPRRAEIATLRRALRERPDDLPSALRFARLAIEEGRARSDPRFLGYARAALAPWWDSASPPAGVRLMRATIRQSLHEFEPALRDLDILVAESPLDAQAWLTHAVVLTVLARYADARASCDRLATLAPPIVGAVCLGGIDGLTGHARDGITRIRAATNESADPAEQSWARGAVAELLVRAGDPGEAEREYEAALAADPDDAYLLAGYDDLLLDRGAPARVVERLASKTHDDGLLLRLVLAELATKSANAEAHLAELRARHEANRARGDVVHRREAARFELAVEKHADRALELARANWDVQREPADARILLEAAIAASDAHAAAPVLAWIRDTGVEDKTLRALAARPELQ